MEVTCSYSDAVNKGSSEVTCSTGTDFTFTEEPNCSISGFYLELVKTLDLAIEKVWFMKKLLWTLNFKIYISDCTSLKTTWTNMKTNKQFPVSAGTVLSLSCNEGYELKGDQTVPCTRNTEFQFSVEPSCGE